MGAGDNYPFRVFVSVLELNIGNFGIQKVVTFINRHVTSFFNPSAPKLPKQIAASRGPSALRRGSTADLSKGTTEARNLREQLAIGQVMGDAAQGAKLPLKMTDPRWPASEGWVKMQQIINSADDPINVHYVFNEVTGAVDDLKIVLPGQ